MNLIRRRPAEAGVRAFLTTLAAAAFLIAATPAGAQAGPTFPVLSGRVVDEGDLISAAKEAELVARLEALERDTSDQLVVVTVSDLQGYEIDDYGYRLGRAWGIGQADGNNGVLLIVAPRERKVRIEVGYGLEPVLTDALSAQIIQTEILPAFKEGYFERGIQQGVDAIDGQLRLDPAEAEARAAAADRPTSSAPIGVAAVVGVIFLLMIIGLIGGAGSRGRRRSGSNVGPILIWAASEALRSRGGGGGFGGGGGGFGGGGGSFGGGGASGGW